MHITKAVVLAAGIGNRLMPITKSVPKPLLDIAGKPMIERILENLKASGIKEFFIVIRPETEPLFKELQLKDFNVTFCYQDKPTGMADAILTAKNHINEDFLISSGDMIIPKEHIKDMIISHESKHPFGTLSLFKANIDYISGYGNVRLGSNGVVSQIIEKPPKDKLLSNFYSLPFYIFKKEIFNYLSKVPLSIRGEKELQDAVQMAITDKQLFNGVLMRQEFSKDEAVFKQELSILNVTNALDYLYANTIFLKGVKSSGLNCKVVEPVLVKNNCVVSKDCLIGPNVVIGKNVTIGSSVSISNAIIQDDCTIGENCIIEYAIVLKEADLKAGTRVKGTKEKISVIELA